MMKRADGVLVMGVIILLCGCLTGNNQEKEGTWTVKEIWDDYVQEGNSSSFASFEPGDIVTIKDIISKILSKYNSRYLINITYIGFASGGAPLLFEGDMTEKYHAGDEVIITLQIIEIEVNGTTGEFFKEAWDGKNIKPIPASSIKHAE